MLVFFTWQLRPHGAGDVGGHAGVQPAAAPPEGATHQKSTRVVVVVVAVVLAAVVMEVKAVTGLGWATAFRVLALM